MKTLPPTKKKRLIEAVVAEFKKIHETIPNINQGGCGIFAYEAYKLLEGLGLRVKLGVITRNKDKTIYHIRNNSGASVTPFDHIVLCVGRKLIDSGGMYTKPNQILYYENGFDIAMGMPLDMLDNWITKYYGWNRRFDKETYTPVIKESLETMKKDLAVLI